jgi:hypothetical protein
MRNEIVTKAIAVMDTAEYGSDAFDVAAWAAYTAMDGGQREVLRQLLFKGPTWDGDICSKAARGDLFDWGLALRCCFRGGQGYTAASYRAFTIYHAVEKKPALSVATG